MADRKRCAIYTRKSTDEGLEQDFNSLDAQREACSAYILSQAAEGWEHVDEHYDDGGWSGGSMDRPGLKQLLADVEANKVDIIVVYKVDRLTRSLADFAKIVETLDEKQASFVSVTQAFNTTNSMGRLTLNVLLSFAQFEREVTGERIRDKIAASKKKGMWMGGPVPIGYRVEDRQLLVEPSESATVRVIFERYVALRSVPRLVDELAGRGVRTRRREYRDGKVRGDIPFTKGPLANALKNPIYTGKIRHGEKVYEGQHDAIINQKLWDEAQAILQANGQDRLLGKKAKNPSLLAGRLVDPDGRPMTPVHTTKKARLYRYYITRFKAGEDTGQPWRVPAGDLDRSVACLVVEWLSATSTTADIGKLEAQADLASRFRDLTVADQRKVLIEHALLFALHEDSITLSSSKSGGSEVSARLPPRLVTHGQERKLALPPYGQAAKEADPVLVKLLAHAQSAHRMVLEGSAEPSVAHYGKRHLWQLLRIGWLAPDIVSAIVDGQQPIGLTGRRLLRAANLPLDWVEQRSFLGFA